MAAEKSRSTPSSMGRTRSEEHTSELQSRVDLVCRLLLEQKNEDHKRRHEHPEPRRLAGSAGPREHAEFRWDTDPQVGLACLAFCFVNDTATTEIYTLSLHDALPI